jgi:hypothetical protein
MQDSSIPEAMPPIEKAAGTKNYELPLEIAIAWRRNWEADLAESQPKNYVRSFRIDREELEIILAIPGMTYLRMYFGRAERGGQDKLILVAVDHRKIDIVNDGAGPFYDLTQPCPTYCDGIDPSWWMSVPAKAKPADPLTEKIDAPPTSYEISRETAVAWRSNWEADLAESQPKNYVRSFRIDREELEIILAIPGMAYLRTYFGRAERGGQDKLILLAADHRKRDIVSADGPGPIFDFTSPCPTTCDGLADSIWW